MRAALPERTSGHCWREKSRDRSKEGQQGADVRTGRRRGGKEGQAESCQKQGRLEGSVTDRQTDAMEVETQTKKSSPNGSEFAKK